MNGVRPPVHVFTYGSLMFPAVWRRVVKGEYRADRGRIQGFSRYRIAGEHHPAMVPEHPGKGVDGIVYFDVSPADLDALDRFEGDAYTRTAVQVELETGARINAWTYVFLDSQAVEEVSWDPGWFASGGMRLFLMRYCGEPASPEIADADSFSPRPNPSP